MNLNFHFLPPIPRKLHAIKAVVSPSLALFFELFRLKMHFTAIFFARLHYVLQKGAVSTVLITPKQVYKLVVVCTTVKFSDDRRKGCDESNRCNCVTAVGIACLLI